MNLLLHALVLVMVIEALGPLLAPESCRRLYKKMSELPDRVLRGLGFSLLCGAVVLVLILHVF